MRRAKNSEVHAGSRREEEEKVRNEAIDNEENANILWADQPLYGWVIR